MTSQKVTLSLPSKIIYVAGSVNGVEKTFTRIDESGTWEAQAEKADDGRYEVEVAAYSEQGLEDTVHKTLWYLDGWIPPVMDRTEQDVRTGTAKGFYNVEDLNRVGSDVRWLAEQFSLHGCYVEVAPRSDWTMEEFPTEAAMALYLENVKKLAACYSLLPNTPPLPEGMANLTWQAANDIEKNLADMKLVLEWMIAAWKRAGTFYAGEGSVILPT